MKIIDVARTCHEANKSLCEGVGDFTQNSWEDAEDWQRESAIVGVEYFIDNPNAPDSSQHDAWMRDKINNGWRFGKEKNPDQKTHPCIVRFENLPLEQQAKDALFKAVCRVMVPLLKPTL